MEGTGLRAKVAGVRRRADGATLNHEDWLRQRLSWLPEDRLQTISAVGKIEQIRAHNSINVNRELVRFVLKGAVRLQYYTNARNSTVISVCGPGDLLSKLFFKEAGKVRLYAITNCVLLNIARKPFLDAVIGSSSEELDKAVDLIFGGAFGLLARYWQTLGGPATVRLAAALLELTHKFGVADSRGTLLDLRLSQKDLARMVGCSRQQLYALIEHLSQRQAVMRQGHRLIVNVDQINQLARAG